MRRMKSYLVSYSWVCTDSRRGYGMINMFYKKHPAYEDLAETRKLIKDKFIEREISVSTDDIVILNIVRMRKNV